MLRLLAVSMTLAGLAAHAALGCHWHHKHEARLGVGSEAGGGAFAADRACHHAHAGAAASDEPCGAPNRPAQDRPAEDGSDCDGGRCVYAGGATRVATPWQLAGLDLPAIRPAHLIAPWPCEAVLAVRGPSVGRPPAPLFVLHCALVI